MEGEGHPILSAFQHLARLEPLDLFFLALAASFDLIPLIFNWALGNQRSKGVSIPESLSAIGAWQRRTRGALQSMDGIVPFSTRAFWSVLFGRATRTGHAAVTEFEERLVLEQLEMDAKLKQLVMPDSLRQLIALEFAHLGTRVTAQREDLEKKSDPNFVAAKDWNPFSQQARMRRSAEKAAYEGKLEIFRDQIQAVRKSNEVLNRGAIAQVAIAAETFLTGLIADAERLKHKVRQSALEGRTDDLEQELISLDERLKRGVVPADMIEALQNNALNVFAADAAKIAAVDVVFKKERLLSIEFSSARQEE
jgi:hypothetical protein